MNFRTFAVVMGALGAVGVMGTGACTVVSGGGTGGSGGATSSSSSSSSSSTTTSSSGGGATSSGGGATGTGGSGGGVGGGAACMTCGEYVTAISTMPAPNPPPMSSDLCGSDPVPANDTGSAMKYDLLAACVCQTSANGGTAVCGDKCPMTCTGSGTDAADCATCAQGALTGACTQQYNDCSNN